MNVRVAKFEVLKRRRGIGALVVFEGESGQTVKKVFVKPISLRLSVTQRWLEAIRMAKQECADEPGLSDATELPPICEHGVRMFDWGSDCLDCHSLQWPE